LVNSGNITAIKWMAFYGFYWIFGSWGVWYLIPVVDYWGLLEGRRDIEWRIKKTVLRSLDILASFKSSFGMMTLVSFLDWCSVISLKLRCWVSNSVAACRIVYETHDMFFVKIEKSLQFPFNRGPTGLWAIIQNGFGSWIVSKSKFDFPSSALQLACRTGEIYWRRVRPDHPNHLRQVNQEGCVLFWHIIKIVTTPDP